MAAAVPQPDYILNRYRVLERIGAGAMGVVYRAHDERLQRDVAVKVLSEGILADTSGRQRFRHEAFALSRLNHPNIEIVYDFDTQEGVDYLIIELIPGTALNEMLRQGPLPEPQVVGFGIQLANGLTAAHKNGVIHRDLKPGNLRVTPDGHLKILDFGLAKLAQPPAAHSESATEEQTRGAAGTLPYMAPEQLRDEPLDGRTDIYAAGVVLYELATGRRPFNGNSALLIDAILNQQPEPPRSLNPRISLALEAVILAAMAKDRAQRFPTAEQLRLALERLDQSDVKTETRIEVPPSGTGSQVLALPPRPFLARAKLILAALAASFIVVSLLTIPAFRNWFKGAEAASPIQSLAVLPLDNISGDPGQQYFADGMTEALITELAQIRALKVISRTSSMQYKRTTKTLPEIARELKVDGVIEGSVQRAGNRVVINVQLIDGRSDRHLHADRFERQAGDVLDLQRDVARTIAHEVRASLTPAEQAHLAKTRLVSPGAHEAYLKGEYLINGTDEQRRKAQQYFEEAIKLDPTYAPGYAGLADYYWDSQENAPRVALPIAKQNALKALELDPNLAHAHITLGALRFYADWDWTGAEAEFKRAIEINPNDAEAHRMYSVFLSAMGRHTEALTAIRRARELDPVSTFSLTNLGWVYYFARQPDAALRECQKAVLSDHNSENAYDCLGSAYLAKGDSSEAMTACQQAVTLSGGDPVRRICLARAYALAGKKHEARKELENLRNRSARQYVPPYFMAVIYAALGSRDEAFTWLDKAYEEHDLFLAWLKVDDALDTLRPDPRFTALMNRVGLPH